MGKVFLATDHNLDTKVVIKIPHAAMLTDAEFVARFQREIRSLVRLRHRSIVSILDVGEQDGVPFAVMQYLEGKSLEDRLASGPQSEAALKQWLPDIATALDFIHREGYVHRDIKPGNILFDREGNAYVGDFGVVKVVGEHEAKQSSRKSLTGAGMVMGTPEYMAPELVMGEPFDHRVDQYALAVTVFESLCGRHPFEGEPGAVMVKQSTQPPPSVKSFCPLATASAVSAVKRGLSKKPEARFESCSKLASALLEQSQANTPPDGSAPTAPQALPDPLHMLNCPGCGGRLRLGNRYAGKTIKCPGCKTGLKVAEDLLSLVPWQADSGQSVSLPGAITSNAAGVTVSRNTPKTSATQIQFKFVIPGFFGLFLMILVAFALLRPKKPDSIPIQHADAGSSETGASTRVPGNDPEKQKPPETAVAMAIISVPDTTLDEETDLQLTISTTQPRVGKARLQLRKGAPAGMQLDSGSGRLTWTPAEPQGPRDYPITIELTDTNGKLVDNTCEFVVTVNEVNRPPVISAIPPQVARANKLFHYSVACSDPDIPANDILFSLKGESPEGLKINDRTGELSWDVSYRVPESSFTITATVADAAGLTASTDLDINVVPLLPLTVPFEAEAGRIAETAALAQKLVAEQGKQPEEFVNLLGMRFRLIPPGAFPKGSPEVRVTKAFYIGVTEVTQGQWCSLMDREVSRGRGVAEGRMTSREAEEFCHRLTMQDGIEYRLPTEAEWEFACRAGTETEYAIHPASEGDDSTKYRHFANVRAFSRKGTAHPVGITLLRDELLPETVMRNRNGFGLWDMHGNVSELCHTTVETGLVVRGGSFQSSPADCSSTSRSSVLDESAGLRLVAVPSLKTQAIEDVSANTIPPALDSLRNSVGMEFVLIPSGQFQMGTIDSERVAGRAEKPQHLVRISRPFYMGRYEVSQSSYEKVMDGKKVQREGSWRLAAKNPSAFSRNGHSSDLVKALSDSDVAYLPIESISWLEANEFCQELTKLISEKNQNRRYRLPTEAEWEYACRAGSETAFSFGRRLNGADANIDGSYPYEVACKGPFQQRTEVVGRSGPPNQFGLFDMHGNVMEWCQDFYDADYYRQSPIQDPQGPSTGTGHVLRGGAWNNHAEDARSASRRGGGLDLAGPFYGFRVVLELNP